MADPKSLETVLLIVICRQMAIENSVSNDFYLRSSTVFMFLIASYPVCLMQEKTTEELSLITKSIVCLCCCFMSQSTSVQSCRGGKSYLLH